MSFKSIIALLVLANYLLLAGFGCISKPDEDAYIFLIKSNSTQSWHYEQSRFSRMDGIENFISESLASKFNELTNPQDQVIISFLTSIDSHFLPVGLNIPETNTFRNEQVLYSFSTISPKNIALAIYSPPDAFLHV